MMVERPDPFLRRQFVAPHRKRMLIFRLAKPFVAALVIVGAPAALAFWLLTSSRFAVRELTVATGERVSVARAEQALAPLHGRHLLWVDLADVESRLAEDPWVAGVAMRKELPHGLAIEIEEKLPAAQLWRDGELYYVERDGGLIAPVEGERDAELTVLRADDEERPEVEAALAMAARWRELQPEWGRGVSEIDEVGDEDFRVHTAALPFPVLVHPSTVEAGLQRLPRLLPEIERRYAAVEAVDLRFPDRVVIQPAAKPLTEEG
jgi:cell division protein FtsQ